MALCASAPRPLIFPWVKTWLIQILVHIFFLPISFPTHHVLDYFMATTPRSLLKRWVVDSNKGIENSFFCLCSSWWRSNISKFWGITQGMYWAKLQLNIFLNMSQYLLRVMSVYRPISTLLPQLESPSLLLLFASYTMLRLASEHVPGLFTTSESLFMDGAARGAWEKTSSFCVWQNAASVLRRAFVWLSKIGVRMQC